MSLTTEQLRALCIKHGVHPNAEGKMPRNAWAAINEMNEMLPVDGIWPIARLSIDDSGQCAGATLYAPGLPAGEHDVFPAAVAQGSGEPVAFRAVWPFENSVGWRRFYSAEDMAIHRSNVEWLGGKAVPLFDAPQPVPPPVEPTEEMCIAGEREVASGRMARYQDWADFCGQIYRAMVKVAQEQAQKGGA